MTTRNRFHRSTASAHADPKIGWMVVASLLAHLVAVIILSGGWLPHARREPRTVFQVDLVNLPVLNPQAGRPDARPEPVKKAPPKEAPPAPAPAKPVAPVKTETVKLAPAAKEKPKTTKPEAAKPAPAKTSKTEEKSLDQTLERLREKQELSELKSKLAALTAKDNRGAGAAPDAPVGMADGRGTEAGPAWDLWLQAFLKANWSLSKYQVTSRDLEAVVRISYDAQGHLIDYKLLKGSGDTAFDDSVKKAILKEKTLPKAPGKRLDFPQVVFNLKDLLE